jgi:hypothetical protein
MRRLAVILSTVALLAAGAAIAVAGGGGSTDYGNAGYHQYHPKPGCGPWKSGGYAGGSGYHFGQPPKDHNRGDCPNPPCDRYSHFSNYGSSQHGDDDCRDDCDGHRYSSFTTNGSSDHGDDDCDDHDDDCDDHHFSNYSQGNQGYGGGGDDDCRSSLPAGSPVQLNRS